MKNELAFVKYSYRNEKICLSETCDANNWPIDKMSDDKVTKDLKMSVDIISDHYQVLGAITNDLNSLLKVISSLKL